MQVSTLNGHNKSKIHNTTCTTYSGNSLHCNCWAISLMCTIGCKSAGFFKVTASEKVDKWIRGFNLWRPWMYTVWTGSALWSSQQWSELLHNNTQHCITILWHASFFVSECQVTTYHQDMDQISSDGVPHFQRQIVGRRYHCAVMAIPCHHGNLQLGHLVFQRRRVVLPEGESSDAIQD